MLTYKTPVRHRTHSSAELALALHVVAVICVGKRRPHDDRTL